MITIYLKEADTTYKKKKKREKPVDITSCWPDLSVLV